MRPGLSAVLATLFCLSPLICAAQDIEERYDRTPATVSGNGDFVGLSPDGNPYNIHFTIIDNLAIVDGDIVIGQINQDSSLVTLLRANEIESPDGTEYYLRAVGADDESLLWPGGVIPYTIDLPRNDPRRSTIEQAIGTINSETVLTLRIANHNDKHSVVFTDDKKKG